MFTGILHLPSRSAPKPGGRLVDKQPPSGRATITGQVETAAELIDRLQGVRDERAERSAGQQVADQSGGPDWFRKAKEYPEPAVARSPSTGTGEHRP